MVITCRWLIWLLDAIPFWMVTGDNKIGHLMRRLGIIGIDNVKDLLPYHIVHNGVAIPETKLDICWLGLVQRYEGDEPHLIPGTETIATQWLLFCPWTLSSCKEDMGRMTVINPRNPLVS